MSRPHAELSSGIHSKLQVCYIAAMLLLQHIADEDESLQTAFAVVSSRYKRLSIDRGILLKSHDYQHVCETGNICQLCKI
jgi:hypothetical protein